jgi:hypothetical protein
MKVLACGTVRRRLGAFHDGELAVRDRLAVAHHLQRCPPCTLEARQLGLIGQLLQAEAEARAGTAPDIQAFSATIASRVAAEREASLPVRVGRMFEDMHLVWAGLSATAATVTCAALLFVIWFLSPPERSDSLAGMLSAMASPGTDRNAVVLSGIADGSVLPAMFAADASEEDLVSALAAVVTQEGRVLRREVSLSRRSDREAVLRLMNAVSEARLQPASLRGNPIFLLRSESRDVGEGSGRPGGVNLIWLLTHTTVRGKIHS